MQVCTLLQTDNHASNPPLSFLQAGCPSCRPTNSVKALKGFRGSENSSPKKLCHFLVKFQHFGEFFMSENVFTSAGQKHHSCSL